MNILDHRILIPKSPQIVWEHLSDLSRNVTWQVNYSSMSYLSSRHTGMGVRWRYAATNGKEYVAETTAWYDRLGYEYILVDGVPFRENKGRIRLQEIPEGTIVQWTFSYDIGGLLGGVRNAITFRRQFEPVMIDSLKRLWRVLNQANDESQREVKSILRAGLDYEARAQYKPRHPSVFQGDAVPQEHIAPVIIEPPISDEDTRPRVPVIAVPPPPAVVTANELTDPASKISADVGESVTASEIQLPVDTSVLPDRAAETPVIPDSLEVSQVEALQSDHSDVSPGYTTSPDVLPEQPVVAEIASEVSISEAADAGSEQEIRSPVEVAPESLERNASAPVGIVSYPTGDTAEVSVFDVFGLPKPSETQEVPVVAIVEKATAVPMTSSVSDAAKSTRSGLRLVLRRRRTRVRRP